METNNIAKFQKIVAGLAPEKRRELALRMKGMSEKERMAVVDRMVELSEQRKIEITARPKVLATSGRVADAPRRNDYVIEQPRIWTERDYPDDNKIEIVKNPVKRNTTPAKASRPQQRPIKKVEPVAAREGREQILSLRALLQGDKASSS